MKDCTAFTEKEIAEIKGRAVKINMILALLLVMIGLMFYPFTTISDLSRNVGNLAGMFEEHKTWLDREREQTLKRLDKMEKEYINLGKKFYWINRNSKEANQEIKKVSDYLLLP